MILRRKYKNKIAVIFISYLLFIGLFPTGALAAEYQITVNGINITDENAADVLNDGTVSYDSASNTLSLNGANINRIVNSTGNALTINVAGENTITLNSFDYSSDIQLIDSNSSLTLSGKGSLTIDGTNQNLSVYCIGASGGVTVDGITLTMKNSNGAGISSGGDITVKNDALVQGDTNSMFYALSGSGKLTVDNSKIIMPLENTSVSGWMAIWVNEIVISGSTFDIAAPCGIYGVNSITIKDNSNVKVTSTISSTSKYPAIWTGGFINIENSFVTAVSTNYTAIYAPNHVTVTGGSVKAESYMAYPAIYAGETLTINGPVTVETATAGSSANYQGNAGTVINTSAETGNTTYKVFSGGSEQEAKEAEDSPFAAGTDVTKIINGSNYFKIEEHTHTGGNANCSSPAICEDCKNEYGTTDPVNHVNLQMVEATPATHLMEGNTLYYYCDGCQKYYSDKAGIQEITIADTIIPKLAEHIADATGWHSDANNHWNICICGGQSNESAHSFEWVTDREATATEAGSRYEKCTVCGYTKTAVKIPATGANKTAETLTATEMKPNIAADNKTVPKTGDTDGAALWLVLFFLTFSSLIYFIAYSRKHKIS